MTRPGGKPWTGAKKTKPAQKTLQSDWNSGTSSTKYFDPTVDPKELRLMQTRARRDVAGKAPLQKSPNKQMVVNSDSPGKMDVQFHSKHGNMTGKLQAY